MGKARRLFAVVAVIGVVAGLQAIAAPVGAAPNPPLVVTNTENAPSNSDGCLAGDCNLYEAVEAANARSGPDVITFALPGAGPHVIFTKPLPEITDALTIDATAQQGFTPRRPVIEVAPDASFGYGSAFYGLYVRSDDVVVKGLALTGWDQGIYARDHSGLTVTDSTFGLSVDGSTTRRGSTGIRLHQQSRARIGDSDPSKANVFAGAFTGLFSTSSTEIEVANNLFGQNLTGQLFKNTYGIYVFDTAETGNPDQVLNIHDNDLAAYSDTGISLYRARASVWDNRVGTKGFVDPVSDGGNGIMANGNTDEAAGPSIYVGATAANPNRPGNDITKNEFGVVGNGANIDIQIRGNSIHDNRLVGIERYANGWEDNSPTDTALPQPPVLVDDPTSSVRGGMAWPPNTPVHVELFKNKKCLTGPETTGEGETLVGTQQLTANASGRVDFVFPFNPGSISPTDVFTATATDVSSTGARHRGTSEFSNCLTKNVPPSDTVKPTVELEYPTDGTITFERQLVGPNFRCTDDVTPAAQVSCVGTTPMGYGIDTYSLGNKAFTVTAADAAGNVTEKTVTYKVIPNPLDLPDNDGDGLPNSWETTGFDVNGDGTIDYKPEGANPNRKDLYLELDYMTGWGPVGSAVSDVVTSFANAPVTNPNGSTGVTLHAQTDQEYPLQSQLNINDNYVANSLNRWKKGDGSCATSKFGTAADRAGSNCKNVLDAKRFIYRYGVFARDYFNHFGSSGIAELGGNDLIVSLTNQDQWAQASGSLAAAQAGTLMHELGHNLGLNHGGAFADTINCKPNHLSVMSYSQQTPNIDPTRPLSFSDEALPTLNEGSLSETAGVGGPSNRFTVYSRGSSQTPTVIPTAGSVDWNGNGAVQSTAVAANINMFPFNGCLTAAGEQLRGHDDWDAIRYSFIESGHFADGMALSPRPFPAEDLTSEKALDTAKRVDFDKDTVVNANDNCRATANTNQSDMDKDGIGDVCDPSTGVGGVLVPNIPFSARQMASYVVAITSTSTFNAATAVDPASVRFGRTGTEASIIGCAARDATGDNRADLSCPFFTNLTGLRAGDTQAVITGKLKTGGAVRATIPVTVRP